MLKLVNKLKLVTTLHLFKTRVEYESRVPTNDFNVTDKATFFLLSQQQTKSVKLKVYRLTSKYNQLLAFN